MNGGAVSWIAAARRHPAAGYALAVVAVLVVSLLKSRFDTIGRDAPAAIYLGAIMFVAWFGGTGPGLLATALSALVGAYYFAAPYNSLAVASADEATRLAIAGVEGTLISLLAGALHRKTQELRGEISERHRAEGALRRANEQAIHTHKMRAIGEFAGSVAHDFNNMLTVVQACVGLLERRLPDDHPGRAEVAEIRLATERAASLARQLLAFARRRNIEPRLVHLHETLTRIEPIVKRVVGPAIEVELSLSASSDLIRGDVAQIEQAVVNLAANARDAMPGGGKLGITTNDVSTSSSRGLARRAGAHVELAICDSGVGMDEQTRSRAFEPFFTTKALGAGTGLGLAMVFGVVEEMGGAIAVESTPGQGATFRLLLPLEDGSAPKQRAAPTA
ncbi:MAG TPA: ATP-binding protein [Polyangiaceae bacterium]|jgi:signal transduction histidine kinase